MAVMFDYANKWKPIFGMMEQYDGFSVPSVIDDEFVRLLSWPLSTSSIGHCIFGGRLKMIGW